MKITPSVALQLLVIVVLVPFLPILITQDWLWWQAWAFAIVSIVGFIAGRVLAERRHPGLLAERAKGFDHADMKSWDRPLAPLVALGSVLIPLVAGLDVRFGWSGDYSVAANWAALVVMIAGYALGTWALVENRFFSGVVRIQTDRGHHVVSGGPYRWVRHPGYVGAVLAYLATPVLLNAAWAFVPALGAAAVLVIRTRLEDATLMEELDGYRAYAERTRYRLLPGVW